MDGLKLMWMYPECIKSASLAYIMRDHHLNIIVAKDKRLGDCPMLVVECLAMREATLLNSETYSVDYYS